MNYTKAKQLNEMLKKQAEERESDKEYRKVMNDLGIEVIRCRQ
jgi:DNA-directed RNA polymerase subunit N (RpoN/RPB10)